jgi:hypothetical protein
MCDLCKSAVSHSKEGAINGEFEIGASQAGRVSDDGEHFTAQYLMRGPGEVCRACAAGVRYGDTAESTQAVVKRATLLFEVWILLRIGRMMCGHHNLSPRIIVTRGPYGLWLG